MYFLTYASIIYLVPVRMLTLLLLLFIHQNEWDDLMLEIFNLKHQLETTRQELAHSLYRNDAANRVIARLMKERDEALTLASSASTNPISEKQAMDIENESSSKAQSVATATDSTSNKLEQGFTKKILDELNDKCKSLSSKRKGRKAPPSLTSKESISEFNQIASYSPHKSDSKTQISCLAHRHNFPDVFQGTNTTLSTTLSGGSDRQVILLNTENGEILAKLTGHSDAVNAVSYHTADSATLFSASSDKTVKVSCAHNEFMISN